MGPAENVDRAACSRLSAGSTMVASAARMCTDAGRAMQVLSRPAPSQDSISLRACRGLEGASMVFSA